MKRTAFSTTLAALALSFAPILPLAARAPVRSAEDLVKLQSQIQTVAGKVMPATVALVSEKTGSSGSGVVVRADGLILTAAHVVQGVEDLTVVFPDGKQVKGKVLGANFSKDIAMVRIEGEGPWPFAEQGESKPLKAGDWVIALGHSAGFDPARTPPVRFGRVVSKGPGNFLTTDCTLIGGDSGGPVFDLEGRVIGINSSIGRSLRNNNHAGIDGFKDDWENLMAGKTWGELSMNPFANPEMPVLGIGMGDDLRTGGVPVREVFPKSPAAAAGVRIGDVVESLDGKRLEGNREMMLLLAKKQPGEKIQLGLLRDRAKVDVEVTLARREAVYDERSLRNRMIPGFDEEDANDVPLLGADESHEITSQFADLYSAAEPAAGPVSESTVWVWTGGKAPASYGTVIGEGNQVLTKWSEIARGRGDLQVVDHAQITHGAKILRVFEDEDLALVAIDGSPLTPVKWAASSPSLGSFLVAAGPSGKAAGLGVVSVRTRSLRETDHAFLGIGMDPGHEGEGVLVGSVQPETGAESAGVKSGDVILKVDGRPISGSTELQTTLIGKQPGEVAKLTIRRDGKELTLDVPLSNRPEFPQFTNPRLRQMEQMGGDISLVRTGFPQALQTDMEIEPNNCGGPVVDLQGNVLGISIARADRTRSFVIPGPEIVSMLAKPGTDPEVAKVRKPEERVWYQVPPGRTPRPRSAPPIPLDEEGVARIRRHMRDMHRLMEHLQEEMDGLEERR